MPGTPTGPAGNPTQPAQIRAIFDRIARRYDLLNSVMTGTLDARWRRAAVRAAQLRRGERVLDVACGTGKLTRAAAAVVGPRGEAVGLDFSEEMLRVARRAAHGRGAGSTRYVLGDAMALPFGDSSFDAVTIGFGLRNLPDYRSGLAEMARVAAPGGRVVVLEIGTPRRRLPVLLFGTWFRRVVPLLGRLAGHAEAYRYLPASLADYPSPERIAELMEGVGLVDVCWLWLTGGLVTLHVARRRRSTGGSS